MPKKVSITFLQLSAYYVTLIILLVHVTAIDYRYDVFACNFLHCETPNMYDYTLEQIDIGLLEPIFYNTAALPSFVNKLL